MTSSTFLWFLSKPFCIRSALLKAIVSARMLADLGDTWWPSAATRSTGMVAAVVVPGLAE